MSDLQKYIAKRKATDLIFAEDFDSSYEDFKIGILLRQARESAGLTQEQVVVQPGTKTFVISSFD
jgi:HTH-type transcriptional regulator / antitoxin HipB